MLLTEIHDQNAFICERETKALATKLHMYTKGVLYSVLLKNIFWVLYYFKRDFSYDKLSKKEELFGHFEGQERPIGFYKEF